MPDKNLYKIIEEILWHEWDPIGVNEHEEERDEYYTYLPQIFNLRARNATDEEIAHYLFEIETKRMGLPGNINNCRRVANLIVSASSI